MNTDLLKDPGALRSCVAQKLYERGASHSLFPSEAWDGMISSSVLLLLGEQATGPGCEPEICVILNKRSRRVRQAGDICCPGGTVEKQLDPYLAKLLILPGSPLSRWPYWPAFRRERPQEARLLSLLFATGLREGWEEMRLNPFNVEFLGPLPYHRLVLFSHVIHPMVGWVRRQTLFRPSWEVEKIVCIPVRSLLSPADYARYRFYVSPDMEKKTNRFTQDFPCFLCRCDNEVEVLWGATYWIVTFFIELIFGFKPPDFSTLPMVPGILDDDYLNGRE